MNIINAANLDYRAVNEALRKADRDCTMNELLWSTVYRCRYVRQRNYY